MVKTVGRPFAEQRFDAIMDAENAFGMGGKPGEYAYSSPQEVPVKLCVTTVSFSVVKEMGAEPSVKLTT